MTGRPVLQRLAETALSPDDDRAIADLCARAFGPDFGGRSYHHQRHHLRIVARGPGIVGHVAITLRKVRLGDRLIEVAGLAEVATDPDRRGQGIAAACLAEALSAARDLGLPFVLLFGDAGLYAGAGFRPSRQVMTYLDLTADRSAGTVTEPADSLMVLPLGPAPWDWDAPLDLMGHLF
jgi:predicted N-acetyltransferase YhbS